LHGIVETKQFNCAEANDACIYGFNIGSYPTLKLFQNGNEAIFYQTRDVDTIVSWVHATTPTEPFLPGKNMEIVEKNMKAPQGEILGFDVYDGEGSKVIVMDNVHHLLKKTKRGAWLVKLHIGSGFDKKLIPILFKVATELADMGILTASVNVFEDSDIIRKLFKVTSFPTLIFMDNGKMIAKYDGEKDPEKITEFVMSHVQDQHQEL